VIKLVIVEDHPAMAEGLAALMEVEPDIQLEGIAHDAASGAELIELSAPDVVLCDVVLHGEQAGLKLLAQQHKKRPPAFVMFSAFSYPDYYVLALENGAAGYLMKMAPIDDVLRAVRTVAAGGLAFPDEVLRAARGALRRPTARQREILALVAEGRSNGEVARSLFIHVKTVEGQLRRLFDRYGVANRTELVRIAEREGWIDSMATEDRAKQGFSV
jgi:DNA-binding NarL/FixJ family response regulator